MTTADYWRSLLPFDHLVSYSLHRQPQLQQRIIEVEAELRTARYMRQPALRCQLEHLQNPEAVPLTDAAGVFNSTSVPIARLAHADAAAGELQRLLMRPVEQNWVSGCIPIYRDALVFYDADGQRLSVLNICLQCAQLRPDAGPLLERDNRIFVALEKWLRRLGHPVEGRYTSS